LRTNIKSVFVLMDQRFGILRESEEYAQPVIGIDIMEESIISLEEFKRMDVDVYLFIPKKISSDNLSLLKKSIPIIKDIFSYGNDLGNELLSISERFSTKDSIIISFDRVVRGMATRLGFLAYPTLDLAVLGIKEGPIHFIKLSGDKEQFYFLPKLIPYHLERISSDFLEILGVTSEQEIAEAIIRGINIRTFPINILLEDPLFVRLDRRTPEIKKELGKLKILAYETDKLLVAIGPGIFNDSIQIHGNHGHFEVLVPNSSLLKPNLQEKIHYSSLLTFSNLTQNVSVKRYPDVLEKIPLICPVSSSSISDDIDKYCGNVPLDSSGPVISRHVRHSDNLRVVNGLVSDLRAMGYCAYTYNFNYGGVVLKNVIADLPGKGSYVIDPDIRNAIRKIFLKYPFPDPPDPWIKDLQELTRNDWTEKNKLNSLSPAHSRKSAEKIFNFEPWFPWWKKNCDLPGIGSELVIIGCHMDSTAARSPGYDPVSDPAPGVDDDGSGMAGTLALARYFSKFKGKLKHTVRFCFFNAEESGIVGSKEYAITLKNMGAPVKAAICMDMIGYNSDSRRIFEIHAGYTDPFIRDLSVPIAQLIANWASFLGTLEPAQIYKGINSSGGSDRNLYDGAINRSDHSSFHQQGYPAVVVSEDFFANLVSEPVSDPNPNYHDSDDNTIDSAYVADIVCAVAFAIRQLAQS